MNTFGKHVYLLSNTELAEKIDITINSMSPVQTMKQGETPSIAPSKMKYTAYFITECACIFSLVLIVGFPGICNVTTDIEPGDSWMYQ